MILGADELSELSKSLVEAGQSEARPVLKLQQSFSTSDLRVILAANHCCQSKVKRVFD